MGKATNLPMMGGKKKTCTTRKTTRTSAFTPSPGPEHPLGPLDHGSRGPDPVQRGIREHGVERRGSLLLLCRSDGAAIPGVLRSGRLLREVVDVALALAVVTGELGEEERGVYGGRVHHVGLQILEQARQMLVQRGAGRPL